MSKPTDDFDPNHDSDLPSTNLEDVRQRRARLRLVQIGTLALLLVVVAVFALHNGIFTSLPRQQAQQKLPTATPTVDPNATIAILSNVSGATVTVNNKTLTGSPPLITTIHAGANTITLSRPPFGIHTCDVDWPSLTSDDGCLVRQGSTTDLSIAGEIVSPALSIVLSVDEQELPIPAQGQVVDAVDTMLQSAAPSIAVPVGEYIPIDQLADGSPVSQRTTSPTQATVLATEISFEQDGAFLNDAGPTDGEIEWRASAVLERHWQFVSSSGATFSTPSWPTQLSLSVTMTYDAQHGWRVDQSTAPQIAGVSVTDGLGQDICESALTSSTTVSILQQQSLNIIELHNAHLQGCEFGIETRQKTSAGYLIGRFGVLLAANAQAHALLPTLPVAFTSAIRAITS